MYSQKYFIFLRSYNLYYRLYDSNSSMILHVLFNCCKMYNKIFNLSYDDSKTILASTMKLYYYYTNFNKYNINVFPLYIIQACYWISYKYHIDEGYDIYAKQLCPNKWKYIISTEKTIMKTIEYKLCKYI